MKFEARLPHAPMRPGQHDVREGSTQRACEGPQRCVEEGVTYTAPPPRAGHRADHRAGHGLAMGCALHQSALQGMSCRRTRVATTLNHTSVLHWVMSAITRRIQPHVPYVWL